MYSGLLNTNSFLYAIASLSFDFYLKKHVQISHCLTGTTALQIRLTTDVYLNHLVDEIEI